ncbi:Auxin-responsive protein [Rhynchospora pubera]|uniref:Auxin-responsive protein n=1 Tax=Rhynchospora pubera TaxID=906938 RepID=A0AAV8DJB4_9POAL|nr:Auxin-responsive protein [Rhynchospora pubera]KAJ4766406.1 Auxin-responsive protein [Rhynchospora pubera]
MKTIQFETPARQENASMMHESVNHLDLSLGISSSNDACNYKNAPKTAKRMISFQTEPVDASPAYKKCVSVSSRMAFDYSYLFSHCPTGFVDPWSLAARQQKAAAEQAHLKANPNPTSSKIAMEPQQAPVVVGWPPIRSSRKSLINQNLTKSCTIDGKDSTLKSEKLAETKDAAIRLELRPTLYVKVNMEGFSVGRKIDLSAHNSYESLSRALQNMFCNFLSNKLISKDAHANANNSEFILLYEDYEGDKILVGDVPWELFLKSVKRLYITRHSSAQEKAGDGIKDSQKEEANHLTDCSN